ncbi:hypothetical protein [Burkholderia stagnalis]|uniref:hypothetical protein n=1 Tax=Burkholderia stagnalis TaxID=1503054 RepID=UPI0012D85A29|nr:hypothetical protein [Burkholderia stagnalis]
MIHHRLDDTAGTPRLHTNRKQTAAGAHSVHARIEKQKSTRRPKSTLQSVNSPHSRNTGGQAPQRVDARTLSDDDNGIARENLRVHRKKVLMRVRGIHSDEIGRSVPINNMKNEKIIQAASYSA